MDEFASGKQKILEMINQLDPAVEVVIPVTPSNSQFLISLTKGPNRKFLTVHEDDLLDLPTETDIQAQINETLKETINQL